MPDEEKDPDEDEEVPSLTDFNPFLKNFSPFREGGPSRLFTVTFWGLVVVTAYTVVVAIIYFVIHHIA
jgi:hypothetical protein